MKSEVYFSEKVFRQLTEAIVAAAEIIATKKCENCSSREQRSAKLKNNDKK